MMAADASVDKVRSEVARVFPGSQEAVIDDVVEWSWQDG